MMFELKKTFSSSFCGVLLENIISNILIIRHIYLKLYLRLLLMFSAIIIY